jgi:ring-1,2-phenylacetyl-CoA epoxidase subunit PaaE
MSKAHVLTISEIAHNTPETVVVSFEVPADCKKDYVYKQGQHLTLIKEIGGEKLHRSYSVCNSVADKKLTIAIRHVKDGRFSTYANERMKVGDTIEVLPPAGHFYIDLDEKAERTYIAFATGSGITPIMSIIKTTLESETKAKFILFYGNRTGNSTIFRNEISYLKNNFMGRFSHFHFLSQEELEIDFFKGRLDAAKVKGIFDKIINVSDVDHAFVCGPEAMIDEVVEALFTIGLKDAQIHSEKFLSEGRTSVLSDKSKVAKGLAKITLIIDDEESTINVPHDISILDAAIESGLDAPFACKGGVCCTCRAKVLKGEVEMVLNQGLEPEDVAAGYVLTCQSFAISEEVTLSYDD